MREKNKKNINDHGNQQYHVTFANGETEELRYTDIKHHNEEIIDDNISYGLMHPGDYSDEEINYYEKEAVKENRAFLSYLRNHLDANIVFDERTEMYVLAPGTVLDDKL